MHGTMHLNQQKLNWWKAWQCTCHIHLISGREQPLWRQTFNYRGAFFLRGHLSKLLKSFARIASTVGTVCYVAAADCCHKAWRISQYYDHMQLVSWNCSHLQLVKAKWYTPVNSWKWNDSHWQLIEVNPVECEILVIDGIQGATNNSSLYLRECPIYQLTNIIPLIRQISYQW